MRLDAARGLSQAVWRHLPADVSEQDRAAWGAPEDDPDVQDGAFRFRARKFGNVIVALAARSRPLRTTAAPTITIRRCRRATRCSPSACGCGTSPSVDAIVHMGAHGTLEWLPGKAVALTAACFPEAVVGPLPVIYPFIVSNPGEAAQAKRRIAAVTLGHLPPPLVGAGLSGDARELERLVDEYAQADGLDRRRRERLARLIVETAQRSGLAREAGVGAQADPDEALRRIDAWLCDLKDFAIKDGLHIYGRAPAGEADPARNASADNERRGLLAALDGRRIARRSRRLAAPRTARRAANRPQYVHRRSAHLPTPTAMDLGRLAADEVVRGYMQSHGEMPRALVIDLWGSATLRTGGEEIAQGLALMGCRPKWDHATGRVTGVEVLPCAAIGRPRVDVTWRISGLFRDLFPAQIALLDAAVQAVAARDETGDENPLAAARRAQRQRRHALARIFGTAPGAYGAGIESLVGREADRADIGAAYLAAASHVYGGADGEGDHAPGAFAARVAAADLLVHVSDDPARDLLEGGEDVAFVGGFAAAAATLGAQSRSRHARHDRSATAARAAAVGRAGPDRARPRDQSALHRRPDAARPARRGRIGRDRRPPGRFRARPPARCRARCSTRCTTLISVDAQVRDFLMLENPARRARNRRAARRRATARPMASAPQRHRREPCGGSGGGCGMNAPATHPCAAAPVRDFRRRWRPATACWPG